MRADLVNTKAQAVPDRYRAVSASDSADRFRNRERSWPAFDWRLPDEADDPRRPPLKRPRFLSNSSADRVGRNLNRRAEAPVEIENPTVHSQIPGQVMAAMARHEGGSWLPIPEGRHVRSARDDGEDIFGCHDCFVGYPSLSGRGRSGAADAPRLSAAPLPDQTEERAAG